MSHELINRITVKKGGRVVISSHSSNDNAPYRARESKSLTRIYEAKGQAEFDKEILLMLFDYCELRGNHPSVVRYRTVINSSEARKILEEKNKKANRVYALLSEEDKASEWSFKSRTDAMKDYMAFERDCEEMAFRKIAAILNPGYCFSTTIYHYDDNGNEYWFDDTGKRRYTKIEG